MGFCAGDSSPSGSRTTTTKGWRPPEMINGGTREALLFTNWMSDFQPWHKLVELDHFGFLLALVSQQPLHLGANGNLWAHAWSKCKKTNQIYVQQPPSRPKHPTPPLQARGRGMSHKKVCTCSPSMFLRPFWQRWSCGKEEINTLGQGRATTTRYGW